MPHICCYDNINLYDNINFLYGSVVFKIVSSYSFSHLKSSEALRPCSKDCPETVEALGPCPEHEALVPATFPVSSWFNAVLNKLLVRAKRSRLLEGKLFIVNITLIRGE